TGAAAHSGGDEHHVGAREMIADLIDHLLGSGAADVRLRAGAQAFGHLHAHLDDALGLGHGQRLRVGVGDDEVAAHEARRDHVVDRIAAGAPDAEHGDPRLELPDIGYLQIDRHGCLSGAPATIPARWAGPPPAGSVLRWSNPTRSSREAIAPPSRNNLPSPS